MSRALPLAFGALLIASLGCNPEAKEENNRLTAEVASAQADAILCGQQIDSQLQQFQARAQEIGSSTAPPARPESGPLPPAPSGGGLSAENEALEAQLRHLQEELSLCRGFTTTIREALAALEGEAGQQAALAQLEAANIDPEQELRAVIHTTMGAFHCELTPDKAPITVANFVGLAEGTKEWTHPQTREVQNGVPYYNGIIFHRVIPGFMIQTGDPLGQGVGGPGFTIQDEFHPELRHRPGTLSMANTGRPNSGGGQFFITERATTHLDDRHSVFGYCDEVDLVARIAGVPRNRRDRPDEDVVMERIEIIRGG